MGAGRNGESLAGGAAPGWADELEELDDLQFWWRTHGPGTPRGREAFARDAEGTRRRWEQVQTRLSAAGMPAFQLDNTFTRSDYTVERGGRRVPAEQAFPAEADQIRAVLEQFPEIARRREAG